jgi:hypothetical protein
MAAAILSTWTSRLGLVWLQACGCAGKFFVWNLMDPPARMKIIQSACNFCPIASNRLRGAIVFPRDVRCN